MHSHFFKISFLLMSIFSITVNADLINKQDVPEKVFNYIYDKYPQAKDVTVEEKTHFGQPLYEVKLTSTQYDQNNQAYQAKKSELFKLDGHFFTNAFEVAHNSYTIITGVAEKKLQVQYPDYKILAMKIVSNPNGVGDEYEIYLKALGKTLDVSITDQGEIISENRLDK